MAYHSHGRVEFRREGQMLILDLYGPWNLEAMREANDRSGPLMREMQGDGPWGLIVEVHGSMLGTSDAVSQVRRYVTEVKKLDLDRVGVAWVVDPSVEGRDLMKPVIQGIYQGMYPLRFFTTLADGQRWIEELIQAAKQEK